MESIKQMKFVLSQRLIAILSKINSEISINSHNSIDFKTKQTFIDIAENMNDSISFILSTKASDLLNVTEEDNENSKFNRKLRDNIELDNDVYTKYRGTMKIGRFINTIFPGKFPASLRLEAGQKSKDVENFVAMYKSIVSSDKEFELFDIVKGDMISYWYDYHNYQNKNGSLGGSCMSDVNSNYFDIYTKNENKVSLVILYSNNLKQKIKGRAILWELDNPENRTYMDRIYTNNSNDEHLFIEFAKLNKWLFKTYQSYGPDSNIVDSVNNESKKITLISQLRTDDHNSYYDKYPYMDTMTYYNPQTGIISNNEIHQLYILNSTYGGYEQLYDNETVYSNYYNNDIIKRDAVWCQIGNDWLLIDDAIKVLNTGLEGDVYAIPNSPNIVNSYIPNIVDKYFPVEKCIWSEYLNTWIFNSSTRKVYTDKEKNNFVIDYKKRENSNFVKIGNDYFDISLVVKQLNGTYTLK